MVTVAQPVLKENIAADRDKGGLTGDLDQVLPEPLKKVTAANPHVLEYISHLPIDKIGMPEFAPELTRKMGDNKKPNYIYPTSRSDVFIHVVFDEKKDRSHYIPIEPSSTIDIKKYMPEIENKLLGLQNKLKRVDPDSDLKKQFLEYLNLVVTATSQATPSLIDKNIGFLRKGGIRIPKIKVTPRELEGITYLFLREKLGLGALDPLIVDPYIEDISCSGMGNIFIEHKIFKSLQSNVNFASFDELDAFVQWLSERVKKPVTFKAPIADATLPDGSRINIVYGRDVSKRGSNFSIRKFNDVPLSVFEILEFGTINYQMLAYLSLAIGNGMNVFVSGETASGKTTLLNALTTFIPPMAKVVTIEDTPELQVPHRNWIREVVQSTKAENTDSGVTMFDLLRAALRQRPDEIMVGEIRGKEGNIAFQAMQTGHSVMATFHAASVEKLIQRITGDPILVPKNYVDNLNVVILTSQVKLPNGKSGRRLTGISEIVNYDAALESFSFVEAFKWNQETDVFEFTGYMSSYVLEQKIAPKMGLASNKKQKIYLEMERRSKILAKLHKEKGVRGFYEVLDVLNRAQKEGLF